MYIHANIIKGAIGALNKIVGKNEQSDDAVAQMLVENPKWGARDRNQATGIVYNIIRNSIQYRYVADIGDENGPEAVKKLVQIYALLKEFILPDEYYSSLDETLMKKRWEEVYQNRALRLSIPQWLDDLGAEQLGKQWEPEMQALNSEAKFCLRINTIRTSIDDVITELQNSKIEFSRIPNLPEAIVLAKRYNLKHNPLYVNGHVEIQDVSSQRVAPTLDAKPNMRVLDACAGAGGKTLHIAALMRNNGQIVATDVSNAKLNILLERARKADVHIVYTFKINETFINNNYQAFDRILIDAPCSSLGTLRRKPDLKHSLTLQKLKEVTLLQQKILHSYCGMLKPGGKMVYSTCSILPMENQAQVSKFLSTYPAFKLVHEETISPAQSGFDGFYMAVIERKW